MDQETEYLLPPAIFEAISLLGNRFTGGRQQAIE